MIHSSAGIKAKHNMNILELASADFGGGEPRGALELHEALLARQIQSHLLVGRRRAPDVYDVEGLYDREKLSSRAWSKAKQLYERATCRQASANTKIRKWWAANQKQWDLVVCHNLHGNSFDLSFLPELTAAQPVVQIMHDLWLTTGHCAYPMDCPGVQRQCGSCPDLAREPAVWIDRTHSELLRKAAVVREAQPTLVCVSSWLGEQVGKSQLRDVPRVVIPWGMPDITPPSESRTQLRERLGWPQDKVVFLYVSTGGLGGNLYKDPDTVVNTAIELVKSGQDKEKLIVTVGGIRPLDPSLSQLVRQYGRIPDTLVKEIYAAADYFIYPTSIETIGTVLIEAARASMPAIAVNVGGCPEIVVPGETGLVIPPKDPVSLARAMNTIQTMDRVAMGIAARRRYENLYTVERMVDKHIALYTDLIEKRAARSAA